MTDKEKKPEKTEKPGDAGAGPKRMVLKTLKRTAAAPPPSPTLRKVTGTGQPVRRVVPKAAPPKPVPPPPAPLAPPAPAVKTPEKDLNLPSVESPVNAKAAAAHASAPVSASPKAAVAKPAVPKAAVSPTLGASGAPVTAPSPVVKPPLAPTPKTAPKAEPMVTYKLPPPPPVKPPKPLVPRQAPQPAAAEAKPVESAKAELTPESASAAAAVVRSKIRIPEILTVKELAEKLNAKPIDVIKKLLGLGSLVTINQQIDSDQATLAADAFGFDVEVVQILPETTEADDKDDPAKLKPRPPIITIMGHVDHGKTSLLDTIRKTRVAEKEAGGITQHIGAYRVPTAKGDVVFLDTPGHEAFTAMRARGAQATDIVVLVVAADDGVMPQTIEAIDHAKAAGVVIMVAVNKIDLPTANVDRIKRDLASHGLSPEDWGGKTIFVEVSAKKGTNVEKLLEMLSLEAELLELKANPDRAAQGAVVEARLDPRRGITATLLIQKGTLHIGDVLVAGNTFGRVKALVDDRGVRVEEAWPSWPVEVLGLSGVPQAGDKFIVLKDEREARALVERRQQMANEAQRRRHVTLENLHERVAEGKIKELKVILKADVQGSVQALRDALDRMSTAEIRLNIIHSGVGAINETDVTLAAASDAVVVGFNVRPDAKAEEIARREEVEIRTYRIIYEAISDIRAGMEGLLEPEKTELRIGRAEVRQVFKVSKGGMIAGSIVTEGKITRGAKARVIRDAVVVHEGTIDSLKRFKDDAREVEKGFECGISMGSFQDVKPKDVIEAYSEESKARKLELEG